MTSIEQHINHYLEVGTNLRVPMKQHLASPGEEVTMATLPRVNLRHLSHWSSQWNRLQLPHTYPYIHLQGSWWVGQIRSNSCMRGSARQPRNANVPNGSLGYDVYPADGTRDTTSQLSSPVSSQRLGHSSMQHTTQSKCDAPSQLFTPYSQPRHGDSNSSAAQRRTVTANTFSLSHRTRDTL